MSTLSSGNPGEVQNDLLLSRVQRVLVRRIAVHTIIHHLARVCHRIAPERLRLNPEVLDYAPRDVLEREGERAPVPVLTRPGGEV